MNSEAQNKLGLIAIISSFLLWGFSPVYWKQLSSLPPMEILCHRIIWSFVFCAILMSKNRRWGELKIAFATRSEFLKTLAASLLLIGNWLLFVWAVNNHYILETSLGHFICPLVIVFFGWIFLKEKLSRRQISAIVLAVVAVCIPLIQYGRMPWIPLGVAAVFSSYALIRKTAILKSLPGFTIDCALLTIPAVGYVTYTGVTEGNGFILGTSTFFFLIGAGVITALPTLLYTFGIRAAKLSTAGMLQYINPTCSFMVGLFIYQEPLKTANLLTFTVIWSAIFMFSYAPRNRSTASSLEPVTAGAE